MASVSVERCVVLVCACLAGIFLLTRSMAPSDPQDLRAEREPLASGDGYKCLFYNGHSRLPYRHALTLLQSSEQFRSLVTEQITKNNFAAVFWELPPISREREQGFEFVVANAPSLASVRADARTFQLHFNSDSVVTFANLGGDAVLVAPCPSDRDASYTHLVSFLRSAPSDQSRDLLVQVSVEAERWLATRPDTLWVSTSGLGVYYLHVRLDTVPKYYTYRPYKDRNYSTVQS